MPFRLLSLLKLRWMKKILLILAFLLVVAVGYLVWVFKIRSGGGRDKGPKPVSLAVSKHSEPFNLSVQSLLNAYYDLSEGFVNWDTVAVSRSAMQLKGALDSLKIEELKVDTTGIYESALDPLANAKAEINNILAAPSIDTKRTGFNQLSDNLRLLFIVVKYDRAKLYWQECPMAFGEDSPGYWLSKTDAVRNPYLGTKHPTYKAGMLECGAPKDTLNFMVSDTLK